MNNHYLFLEMKRVEEGRKNPPSLEDEKYMFNYNADLLKINQLFRFPLSFLVYSTFIRYISTPMSQQSINPLISNNASFSYNAIMIFLHLILQWLNNYWTINNYQQYRHQHIRGWRAKTTIKRSRRENCSNGDSRYSNSKKTISALEE